MMQTREAIDTARRLGFELWHPAIELDELRRKIDETGGGWLEPVEQAAYAHLSPGAFWSAFGAGWHQARAAAAHV